MWDLHLSQFTTAGKESCSNRTCELLCGLFFISIFVGVDTFFIRENQVGNFNVEITNFRSLF
jgi:hypothetical protein